MQLPSTDSIHTCWWWQKCTHTVQCTHTPRVRVKTKVYFRLHGVRFLIIIHLSHQQPICMVSVQYLQHCVFIWVNLNWSDSHHLESSPGLGFKGSDLNINSKTFQWLFSSKHTHTHTKKKPGSSLCAFASY